MSVTNAGHPGQPVGLRRYAWALPTVLAALVALRVEPLTTLAGLVLLCYLPGRLVARWTGLAGHWDAAGRSLLAVAFSLVVLPVVLNPLWHLTNARWPLLAAVWALLTLGELVEMGLARRRLWPEPDARLAMFARRRTRVAGGLIAALVILATIGPYWPTELRGYPMPALIHDFIKHHAVLFSLERQPLPLGNPFFADGAAGPTYYYHFFYLIPATLRAWSDGLSIELAFGLASALVALATTGVLYLTVKRFAGDDNPAILAALLATAIGGLDVIALLILRQPVVTLDAWADHPVRIHPLFTQMIWSPQNVQGLLATLVAVLLLSTRGWFKGWLLWGPLIGAGLVGSSVWVAAGTLPGLVVYCLWETLVRPGSRSAGLHRLAGAAMVAILLAAVTAPTLLGYLEMSRRIGKGLTMQWPRQSHALLGRLTEPGPLANLLDLPWVLSLEFGPVLLLPLCLPRSTWRRAWQDAGLRWLMISAVLAIGGYVTFRSYFTYNDFGQKSIMVALAAGTILAACVVSGPARPVRPWNPLGWGLCGQSPRRPRRGLGVFVAAVLLLGLPQGCYQAPVTAIRRYLPTQGALGRLATPDQRLAQVEHEACRFLRYELPAEAVLQADPGSDRLRLLQVARRPLGVTVLDCDTMVFYPAHPDQHAAALAEVSEALAEVRDAVRCRDILLRHHITHVYVGTLERQRWQGLEKFERRDCFRPVHDDGTVAVYELLRAPDGEADPRRGQPASGGRSLRGRLSGMRPVGGQRVGRVGQALLGLHDGGVLATGLDDALVERDRPVAVAGPFRLAGGLQRQPVIVVVGATRFHPRQRQLVLDRPGREREDEHGDHVDERNKQQQ